MRLGRIHQPADIPARAEMLRDTLIDLGLVPQVPAEAGREPLEEVHAVKYLDFLETAWDRWNQFKAPGLTPGPEVLPNVFPYPLPQRATPGEPRPSCPSPSLIAQTGWYVSDLSSPIGLHTWRSVLRSAHSALAASLAVSRGERQAYALCRPSGHHAHSDRAAGFTYVNNSALAAQRLGQRFGRVAVLDVDAHHGNGTQQIFYERPDVLTVSIHADPSDYYPFYTGYADECGAGEGVGFNMNLPLAKGSGNAEFFAILGQAQKAIEKFAPHALVLSVGFDTFRDDPIGVLRLNVDAYQHLGKIVRGFGVPTVIVQEGGYCVDALGSCLRALIDGLGS